MEPFVFDTDITAEWAKGDLEYSGAVMCHVYTGRGMELSADNEVSNVLTAYRFACALTGAEKIFFVTNGEDVGFAPVDSARKWGEDEGRLEIPDALMWSDQPIVNESMALLVYWDGYGFAGGEDDRTFRIREIIAEFNKMDARLLMEPQ